MKKRGWVGLGVGVGLVCNFVLLGMTDRTKSGGEDSEGEGQQVCLRTWGETAYWHFCDLFFPGFYYTLQKHKLGGIE